MKAPRILRHSIATLLCLASTVHAATLTWDITPGTVGAGDSAITGGGGTWDTANGNWTTDGGANNLAWTNGDSAIFQDTGGALTLGAAITADDLTFSTAGYSIGGGTLTLAGTPAVTTTADASISSVIAGTDGLTKLGAGQLTLTGANTFTGTTVLNNGTLVLGSTGGFAINGNVQMGAGAAGNLPNLRMAANEQFGSGVVMTFLNPAGSYPRFDLQGTTQSLAGMNDTTGAGVTQNEKFGGGGTAAAGTLTLNGSGSYAYNGYLRDEDDGGHVFKLNIIKSGAGTQTLSGGNITYQGTTTVDAGRLELLNATAFASAATVNTGGTLRITNSNGSAPYSPLGGTATIVVNAGGVLELNNATAGYGNRKTLAAAVSGAGTINVIGTGYLALNSVNNITLSGQINIQSGGLGNDGGASANAFGATTADLDVSSGAFFDLRGGAPQFDALTGAGEVINSYTANTITLGVAGGSGVFTGTMQNGGNAVTGSGSSLILSLTKTGGGTQTLTGANTYSGATTVNGGSLVIQNLASGSNNGNLPGGKVFTTPTLNVATGATVVVDLGATSLASTNAGLTFSGAGTIRKNGAGTWWLGNAGGGTAISMAAGGLLDVQGGVLKNDYANANWSGNSGNLNIATGASVDMRNNSVRVGALTGGGLLDNGYTSAQTLTIGAGGAGGTFTGNVTQTGGGALFVTKIGAGTQTLGGSGTSYSGTTTVSQGTLILDGTNLVNASAWSIAAGTNLTVSYANTAVDTWASGGAVTGTGTLTKTGPGWFLFKGSAPANFQGSIVINGGRFGNGFNTTVWTNSLADVFVAGGAELDLRVDDMIVDELTGNGTVINTYSLGGSDTLTVGSNNGSSQFDGVIRGIGGVGANNTSIDVGRNNLAKIGTGTFTLTGASVYGGSTTVSNGILRIDGGSNRLPVGTTLAVNGGAAAGGTFDLNAQNQSVAALTGGSGAVLGVVTNRVAGTGTLTVTGTSTFDGVLQNGGAGKIFALTKSGNGALTLTGASTHSGATLINAGAIRHGGASAFSPNSNIQLNGGLIEAGFSDITNAVGTGGGQIQWLADGGFSAFGAPRNVNLGGAGATLTWNAGGFVPDGSKLLFGAATGNDTATLVNGIDLGGATRTVEVLNSAAAIEGALGGTVSNGTLNIRGMEGTLAITGQIGANTIVDNTITSSTNVMSVVLNRAGGTAIAGGLQIGATGNGQFATVRLGSDNQIGDTTVVTYGASAGSWSYLNLYGFSDTIGGFSYLAGATGGVVQLVEADASPATNSTLTLYVISGTQSFFGHIRDRNTGDSNHPTAGKLAFVKTGAGTQELSTFNTQRWTGDTTVREGTLRLYLNTGYVLPGALSVDAATLDTNATLDLAPNAGWTQTMSGAITGSHGTTGQAVLLKSNAGTAILTGANTFAGTTRITGGALRIGAAGALSPSSNVELNGGVLELGVADFTDTTGTTGGKVQWTGSGGFSAFGGTRIVNVGGAGAGLTWGAGNFVPGGSDLILSGPNADSTTRFINPIDLAGGSRRIASLGGNAAIDAELAGDISNGSLTLAPGNATFAVTGQINGAVVVESGTTVGTNFQQVLLNRAGGNAITGNLQIGTAAISDPASYTTVRLEAADQIADTSVVTFGAAQARWAYLHLNGFDETIAGLSNLSGRDGGVVQLVESDASPATNSTLTLNVTSGTQSFYGHIRDRQTGFSNHATAGKLNFLKTGSGTQELTAWSSQSWSGTTSVTGGTLKLTMNNALVLPGAMTVDATSDPLATLEFSPTGANNYNVTGTLSGNGTLVKSGTGSTSLANATVSLSGNILIQQGTLRNDNNAANWSGSSANLSVSGGATLDMRADSVRVNALTGAGTVTNSFGNGVGVYDVLTVGVSGGGGVFSGEITDGGSGSGEGRGGISFTKLGAGTQTLSGTNTYNGVTTVTNGTLRIGNGGTTGTLGAGAVTNDAALVFDRSNTITVGNVIGGTGSLTKNGAGKLVLTSQNTYGGPTTIAAGTLQLGASQPLALLNSSAIWLDATDGATINTGGGGVLSWTNKGTLLAAGDAVAAVGQEPTFVASEAAMNNQSVIHFASTGGGAPFDRLTNAQDFTAGNVTVMYAGRLSGGNDQRLLSSTGNNWLLGTWGGQSESAYFTNGFLNNAVAANTAAHVYTGTIATGGAASFYVNGALRGTGGGAQGPNGLSLGGGFFLNTNIENSNGDIGEMFVFSSVLGADDRRAVESYLARKWQGVGSTNILPTAGAVSLTVAGAALDVNGVTQTIGALSGVAGTAIALNGGSLTTGGAGIETYAGSIGDGIDGLGIFTKAGAGTLTLTGAMTTLMTLTADDGILNIQSAVGTGTSTINADATVNIYASQTLDALNIAAGVEVTFGDGLPFAGGPGKAPAFGGAAVVPEPGSLASLALGLSLLLARRRRPAGK